ncbi:MAG TPA: arginine--tRNA ligase [Chloroflexota bacterium]|nr:arginine--tRNA ligase [Chloroflexota bacterium]
MVKHDIARLLDRAVAAAQERDLLPAVSLPEIPIERPANPTHGDYASSLPLKLARAARMAPLTIAQRIADQIDVNNVDFLEQVTVAAPGFINFTLDGKWLQNQVEAIVTAGPRYGEVDIGAGRRVQIEFVSANPTGHLTAASGRAGAFGDALANVMAAAGFAIEREYYINNAGSRMDVFYASIWARYHQLLGHQAEIPADGYHGESIVQVAQQILDEHGDLFLKLQPDEAMRQVGQIGLDKMVEAARADLGWLGIRYDVWFSEQSLFDTGLVARVLDLLRERGVITEREGAVWFTSTALGEDKDNVLIRSNGVPTYFASDIAYHYDKFVTRGFDQVINIWGADHQGHVPRMIAAVGALGIDPARLTILVHQLITLRRGEEIIRMSKRTGNVVTLHEVLEEVGPDACRFFFLSRSADTQMDFDLELAKTQSNENPVYYVQYAHARIASILRYAGELADEEGDVSVLTDPAEHTLIRKMLQLPELVETAALNAEPHHLPFYAQDLAATFHSFYTQCRVVSSDEPELSRARLMLVRAAKTVLANTLRLMGVTAPDQM